MDLGHTETDKELKKLETALAKEYRQAAKELKQKTDAYFSKFAELDKKNSAKVKAGKMSQDEYLEWRKNKILMGKNWEDMRDTLATDLTNVDKIAAGMINQSLPNAYALNMNYGTYEIENGLQVNTGFTLYDKFTVKNLMQKDPKIIPQASVNIPKDQVWNRKKLTSAITQGVLQGENIDKISNRLMSVTDMSKNAAIRNARTYTTAAENKGRIDSYERAKDMGLPVKQQWMATLDGRTRTEHRHLDGQVAEVGEYFEANGYKIKYPGDPSAHPLMIYNCRCTLVAYFDKYGKDLERNTSKLDGMTYEEWKGQKEEETTKITTQETKIAVNKNGYEIIYDWKGKEEKFAEQQRLINDLSNEYNTRLKLVTVGAEKSAGDVGMDGAIIRINTKDPSTSIHEFGHTLANTNADKYGLTNDEEFWKEIKKIRKEYMQEVGDDTTRWISSYEHSSRDLNEFMCEAFTQAKLHELGLEIPEKYGNDFTYSNRVLETVNKYFKKTEEITPKRTFVFIPAKTVEEAEKYAKTFVDDNQFGALGISYKGVGLDVANEINATIGEFYETYDVDMFGGVYVPKGNTKLGKLIEDAHAAYSPVRNSFMVNNKCKTNDYVTNELSKEKEIVADFINNPNKYDTTKMKKRTLEVLNNSKESGRGTVPENTRDIVNHELGHSLGKKIKKATNYNEILNNMKEYAPKISGYACDSFDEYVAESFCSYQKGEKLADPEIIKAFKELERK